MKESKVRTYLRSHVLGLVAIFIALSGTAVAGGSGSGGDPQASGRPVSLTAFKRLKLRVRAIEQRLNSPVSGDLTGIFPNLQIAANAVGTDELADDAVNSAKIQASAVDTGELANAAVNSAKVQDNSLTENDLGSGSVTSSELGTITTRTGAVGTVPANTGVVLPDAACAPGERVLTGGIDVIGFFTTTMVEEFRVSTTNWHGDVRAGANADTAQMHAECLAP
jgi:hypothetical protein